ncbi:MAG: hypothetical protein IPK14_15940 [Blastocatellia bacterium]|nr:hypothetical protein [Blastocatellia bacterium]MBL8193413.1 hypothetical protein [Blastocatellia bacterium]MBN8721878.1 hypothetical protein [Acidobacteriota bacterium]
MAAPKGGAGTNRPAESVSDEVKDLAANVTDQTETQQADSSEEKKDEASE